MEDGKWRLDSIFHFPPSPFHLPSRGWLTGSLLVLLGLILAACGGGGESGGSGGGPIQVTMQNTRFNPNTLTVQAGQAVTVELSNKDNVPHTFEVEGVEGVGVGIPPGNEGTLDFTIDQPGTYTIFCGVPGHREAGMVGELIVEQ